MSDDNGADRVVWLTKQEAADYLGMSARWLREQMEQRKIPYHKRGLKSVRFDKRDLDAVIAADRVEARVRRLPPRRGRPKVVR